MKIKQCVPGALSPAPLCLGTRLGQIREHTVRNYQRKITSSMAEEDGLTLAKVLKVLLEDGQILAPFPGVEGEERECLVHTVCACA